MQFFTLVLLICFFVFLYCVYVLSNDDFIFLRRDVTMEKLFNKIFIGLFVSLFAARLFYGFFNAKSIFSNLLVFLLVPYFPGLSLLGLIIGVGAYVLFLSTRKQDPLPLERICDFFSIAFLISLPIGFIGNLLFLQTRTEMLKVAIQAVSYFILFIVFLKFFLPRLLTGKFKEGIISLLFLICFSSVSLISNAFLKITVLGYLKNLENIMLMLILLLSTGVVFWYGKGNHGT